MGIERGSALNESTTLEDEPEGEGQDVEDKDKESEVEKPSGDTSGNREKQDRVDPKEQDLLAGSTYENYYANASVEDLKQTIDYLDKVRQQANEVKILRFVTGRGSEKPGDDPAGLIQKRPDLKDLFRVGSLSNPDEETRYMTDVSAAHDLIEYLVAETEQAIKQKEQGKSSEEYGPGERRGGLPTDTAENPGDVPEQVKEGKGQQRGEGDSEGSDSEYGPRDDDTDFPTDTAGDVPESVKEGKGNSAEEEPEGEEDRPDEEDEPEGGSEEQGGGQEGEEEPDQETEGGGEEQEPAPTPDIELEEGPDHPLRKARRQYLKGVRLRGKMLRGEWTAKAFEWSPWHDKRSVEFENDDGTTEELFFGHGNGEENLEKLRDEYQKQLESYRDDKITEFIDRLDDDLSESEKEQAISSFAIELKSIEMEREESAFDQIDESFDDTSFRDVYRRDDVQNARMATSVGLIGLGAATGGIAPLAARGAMTGAGAAVGTEQALERVHAGGKNPLSRTGKVADIKSRLGDNPSEEEIAQAVGNEFASDSQEGGMDTEALKKETARIRMLANDMGTSLDQAVAGSDDVTEDIINELMRREESTIGHESLSSVQEQIENQEISESEAVHDGLMKALKSEESIIHGEMESHNDSERAKKIARRLLGGAAGGTVGWLIGSGTMGRLIGRGIDWAGEIDIPGPWGEAPETPPSGGPGAGDLPPEMQPEPDADTIFDVEVTDWDGTEVYGDETKARSFIEATGDIKTQMQNLDAFDVTGGQGAPLNNLEAAENLQEFLDGDIANDLAERLDGYRPEEIKESLVVHPGETLSVTKEGNLILEQANGETELLYNGAQDQVNADVLKDDLFGDFDTNSGPETANTSDVGSGAHGDFPGGGLDGGEELAGGDLPESSQVDAAGPDDGTSLEEQLEQTPGEVDQEIPSPPGDEAAEASTADAGQTNAGVEGTNNQAGVMEDTPQMTDTEGTAQMSEEAANEGAQQTAEQSAESGAEQAPDASPAEGGGQGGEIEDVSTGNEALDVSQNVSAEEMQSIIEASDTGLETYPRDLAANLAISDAEGLQVSSEELTNLIDTMPPQSEYSTVTDAIESMDSDQLENLYEILEYHQNNPESVAIDMVPDMQNEVQPLQDFVNSQYQELNQGESIQQALDQSADAAAEASNLSDLTEVPAGISDQELLQYAQENLPEGEVFRSGNSAFVYVEGDAGSLENASSIAETEARGALSEGVGQDVLQGSHIEQRTVSETADGKQVGVLMEMPLN